MYTALRAVGFSSPRVFPFAPPTYAPADRQQVCGYNERDAPQLPTRRVYIAALVVPDCCPTKATLERAAYNYGFSSASTLSAPVLNLH